MHLTATAPARLDGVTLRLAHLDNAGSRACIQAGFAASTAYISLSPGLVCMFDSPSGTGLTHQDIGAAGFSAHQLWNAAAAQLTEKAQRPHGAEFLVRCPSVALGGTDLPRGFEVDGHGIPAAWWLAHPRPFSLLHRHFEAVLRPGTGLVYASQNGRELFVFDADASELSARLPGADVWTYSVGFPLLRSADSH